MTSARARQREVEAPRVVVPGAIAGSDSPPFVLPGEHFVAAMVCWVLGGVGLVWAAPHLATGLFPLPRVIAVTHLFTLGWITLSILGALYQFLPVALGVPVRSERVAHLTFALYAPGLVAFVVGLWLGVHGVLVVGAVMFGSGLLLFAGNLVATLVKAPERGLTWWSLLGAVVFLVLTVVLGLMLAANLGTGFLGENRFLAMGVHVHVAVVGWVMLVVIGVAHRLLPMFLLSHGASEVPGRVSAVLVGSGVSLLALLHHSGFTWSRTVPAVVIGAGVVAFLVQGALYYRHSRKPRLDAGMRLAAVGLVFLGLALVLAPVVVARGVAVPRLAVAYVGMLLVGGFGLFVAAHYYKIVPFLVWFHRFGPLVGKRKVPQVAELYGSRVAHIAAVLLSVGALGVVVGILAGHAVAVRIAGVVFTAGTVIQAAQLLAVVGRRPG